MGKLEDLVGSKRGKLTVVSYKGAAKDRQSLWEVVCDCGNSKTITRTLFFKGRDNCGCTPSPIGEKHANFKDLSGKIVGYLTVLKSIGMGENGRVKWETQCQCGKIVIKTSGNIVDKGKGNNSCGCVKSNLKHDMSKSRVYQVWSSLKRRCDDPKNKAYPDYGGRGVSYCDKWKTFEGFWEDMQEGYSAGMTIDRKDVNGDYLKENCRWIPKARQPQGTRKRRDKWTSKFKGVALQQNGMWLAQTQKDRVVERAGPFVSEIDAARAYDEMVLRLFGEYATTNASIGLL